MKDSKSKVNGANTISNPGLTRDDQEKDMIIMAMNLAKKQMEEGTASSQIISHYLKLGSTRELEERKLLLKKIELLEAQIESIKSESHIEELFDLARKAMTKYTGDE